MVIIEKRSCDGNVCLINFGRIAIFDVLFFLQPTTILVCVYSKIGSKSLKWVQENHKLTKMCLKI